MTLLEAFRDYSKHGYSTTLTNEIKECIVKWKVHQSRLPEESEVATAIAKAQGIAIICGKVSGHLELIDVDTKYDLTGTLWNGLWSEIPDSIRSMLVVAGTVSGGYHLYYKCPVVEGNLKLAQRETTEEERIDSPHEKVKVLIETRGEGGYAICYPSPGYKWITGDHTTVKCLTVEQRKELHTIARSFNTFLAPPQVHRRTETEHTFTKSPIDDYNERGDVLGLLTNHGWTITEQNSVKAILRRPGKDRGKSGDYLFEKKWFGVFSTSTEFEIQKAYTPAAVYCKLECGDDWHRCAKALAMGGYGEKRTVKVQLNSPAEMVPITFWDYDKKDKLYINRTQYIDFLSSHFGYYLFPYDDKGNDKRLIQIREGLVEEATTEKMKKDVCSYLVMEQEVLEAMTRGHATYFADGLFEFLPVADIEFLTDSIEAAYFPFTNGIVKVTSKGTELLKHGGNKKAIWRSAMIPFSIAITNMDTEDGFSWDERSDEYAQFVYNIAGKDPARFQSAMTTIGYLLHKYKDPTRAFAVIFCEETDNEDKGGGTGKGLVINAISQMIKCDQIDGKNFKQDKSFAFQRMSLDTRLIAIQDIRQKVDFEGYYSTITDGITIERKRMDEIHIPYSRSPKICFTTNYMVQNQSNHARRRQRVLPFSSHYTPEFTPADEIGHRLFDDWDRSGWVSFYNFMFSCAQAYLTTGIVELPFTDTMRLKSIKSSFGSDFKEWFDHYRMNGAKEWTAFKDLYSHFLSSTDNNEKDFSKKRFKKGLEVACDQFKLAIEDRNQGPAGGREIRIIS